MTYKEEWEGTPEELEELTEEIIDLLQINGEIDLDETDMRKLFCDTLSCHEVQELIRSIARETYTKGLA